MEVKRQVWSRVLRLQKARLNSSAADFWTYTMRTHSENLGLIADLLARTAEQRTANPSAPRRQAKPLRMMVLNDLPLSRATLEKASPDLRETS